MLPQSAVIKGTSPQTIGLKVAGLFVIERNIKLLSGAGVKKISLLLSEDEKTFFYTKIARHLENIDAEIAILEGKIPSDGSIVIPSTILLQQYQLQNFNLYFKKNKKNYEPIFNDEMFIINSKHDCQKAEKILSDYIIKNTGGFIAQKINKRISIPISRKLANTRIHPNYLTIFNMLIGLASSLFILLSVKEGNSQLSAYLFMLMGRFLFQAASVLDGVDGEVAKFTLKVSKIGGWLDTISDNTTLLLFLISTSYVFYRFMGGLASIITIAVLFTGLALMLANIISYLSKYSQSGSLVAYDKEFLQKLPQNDKLVSFSLKMKYITKKELFSLFFFLFAFTGKIYYIIPLAAIILVAAGIILSIINMKYLKKFGEMQ